MSRPQGRSVFLTTNKYWNVFSSFDIADIQLGIILVEPVMGSILSDGYGSNYKVVGVESFNHSIYVEKVVKK